MDDGVMSSPRVAVKICGLREAAHIRVAATAGAAMIGFVFAPSKRQIAPEVAAARIAELQREHGAAAPVCVGVFVNETPVRMAEIAALCDLDVVQLSGDELACAEDLITIGRPVIRVFRLAGIAPDRVEALITEWQVAAATADRLAGAVCGPWGRRVLIGLDAQHAAAYGGTGVLADWTLAAALAAQGPLMLAGGLTPANVPAALAAVRPWAVDVSSGVEIDGVKDPALIAAFCASAVT